MLLHLRSFYRMWHWWETKQNSEGLLCCYGATTHTCMPVHLLSLRARRLHISHLGTNYAILSVRNATFLLSWDLLLCTKVALGARGGNNAMQSQCTRLAHLCNARSVNFSALAPNRQVRVHFPVYDTEIVSKPIY